MCHSIIPLQRSEKIINRITSIVRKGKNYTLKKNPSIEFSKNWYLG